MAEHKLADRCEYKQKHSVLTFDQQMHVRRRMMISASKIANQLDEFVDKGQVIGAGNEVKLTTERLAAYKLILERTVPTLSSTEIKRTSVLESLSTEQLVDKLAQLVKARPELAETLTEALGGRVIAGEQTAIDIKPT